MPPFQLRVFGGTKDQYITVYSQQSNLCQVNIGYLLIKGM